MNPSAHELMAWTSVFDTWRQRVLLTPRSPSEWNAMERVLATKFRILPANMRGLDAMPDTFDALDAPIVRVAQEDVPMPYNERLEKAVLPSLEGVIAAVQKVCYV